MPTRYNTDHRPALRPQGAKKPGLRAPLKAALASQTCCSMLTCSSSVQRFRILGELQDVPTGEGKPTSEEKPHMANVKNSSYSDTAWEGNRDRRPSRDLHLDRARVVSCMRLLTSSFPQMLPLLSAPESKGWQNQVCLVLFCFRSSDPLTVA